MPTNTKYKFNWTKIAKYSEKEFIRVIVKKYNNVSFGKKLDFEINLSLRAASIFEENINSISDDVSQFHILLMSYVLASVQIITNSNNEEIAKNIAKETFTEIGKFWVIMSFKIGMFLSNNKFDYIIKNCGDGIKEYYGTSFNIEVNTDRKNYLVTQVTKCGFHEFFKKNGRPELTSLLCNRDYIWANLLKNNQYVEFNRPTTIASGKKTCDFIFKKNNLCW